MSILWNGDCNELMSEVEDRSVDLIFTDLPYGQVSCEWDKKIDLVKMWEHFMRIKKTHTPIFFCCSTKFGVELIQSAPKKCPFRYDIVWVKSAPCGFLLAKKMPLRKHEMLYVFYEHLPLYDLSSHKHKFLSDKDSVVKYDSIYNNKGKSETPIEKHPVVGQSTGQPRYDPPLPNSILEVKSQKGRKHSTQKPVDLMKFVLKYYSKEEDVILDPTMGSGSTGVACKEMNRNFIGIEMDPEIYESAVNRIE
jgi:site-specific DNA-methyltransferase (adenine-specific)